MRALLTHSLRRLILGALLVSVLPFLAQAQIPQPIGHLSDYGAVLDRHGRDRIEAMIEEAWVSFGVEVFILASWESPYESTAAFAAATADAWNLSERGRTLLLVLVKAERDWTHAVVGTADLARSTAPERLQEGIGDLVAHRRIEEAMASFFSQLPAALGNAGDSSSQETRSTGNPLVWIIPVVLLAAAALILGIRRFVCPRCGRLLRRGIGDRGRGVYSCRSCGFRREI